MGSTTFRIAIRATVATALSILASLAISWTVLSLTGGALDGRALILTILCPLLIAGPVSTIQFWQNERLRVAHRLAATMNEQLETLHAALVNAHAALAEKARRDGLTGLLNREGFFVDVGALAAEGGALLMIDVDHFKQINDAFGHLNGDQVLGEIAGLITQSVGADGIVGRIGGEEFTAFLPHGDIKTAKRFGERICAAVAGHTMQVDDGRLIRLSVSIGGADHRVGGDISATLSTADDCLYEAKKSGRNRTIVRGERHAAA